MQRRWLAWNFLSHVRKPSLNNWDLIASPWALVRGNRVRSQDQKTLQIMSKDGPFCYEAGSQRKNQGRTCSKALSWEEQAPSFSSGGDRQREIFLLWSKPQVTEQNPKLKQKSELCDHPTSQVNGGRAPLNVTPEV